MNITVGLLLVTSMSWVARTTVRNQGCLELPPANVRAADAVRDTSQWQNPYLVVYPKWIELITGRARKEKEVPLPELEKTLRSLPAADWPYGRIAAVQEAGVRSGSRAYDKLNTQNEKALERILIKLCVKVSHWPSA
jgi:hypothetical protein